MIALFIILGIVTFVAASVYFGGINHKIQKRRCRASHSKWDCSHNYAIFFGYPLWFVILPAVLAYESPVGRLGASRKVRRTRGDRLIEREQAKQRLSAEKARTLAAEKQVLELQLDLARLNDIATDGKGSFPVKDFNKA